MAEIEFEDKEKINPKTPNKDEMNLILFLFLS